MEASRTESEADAIIAEIDEQPARPAHVEGAGRVDWWGQLPS